MVDVLYYAIPFFVLLLIVEALSFRLFRTFIPESERVRYGLTTNIDTFNPVRVAFGEYGALLRDLRATRGWRLRVQVALRGPGWRPADD